MNWAEIRELHNSGHVDFQSHTLHHHLVPTSERIFDFVNPQYDVGFYANVHIPLYAEDGTDRDRTRAVTWLTHLLFEAADAG